MEDVTDLNETKRRRLLGAAGTVLAAGLAGCTGSDSETGSTGSETGGANSGGSETGSGGSEPDETRSESNDSTSTTTATDAADSTTEIPSESGNDPGDYPTQETSGLEAEADNFADSNDSYFAFKIDDYDFLNVEEFPDIDEEYDGSSLDELAETEQDFTLGEALYVATNYDSRWGESDSIYFLVESPSIPAASISMYVNLEDQNGSLTSAGSHVNGKPTQYDGVSTESEKQERQEEFFRDIIDPDGIVHAVDLAEHDYAIEALHSGYGSD